MAQEVGRAAVCLEELGEIIMPEQRVDLSGEMAAPFRLESRMIFKGVETLAHAPELVLQRTDADCAAKKIHAACASGRASARRFDVIVLALPQRLLTQTLGDLAIRHDLADTCGIAGEHGVEARRPVGAVELGSDAEAELLE